MVIMILLSIQHTLLYKIQIPHDYGEFAGGLYQIEKQVIGGRRGLVIPGIYLNGMFDVVLLV